MKSITFLTNVWHTINAFWNYINSRAVVTSIGLLSELGIDLFCSLCYCSLYLLFAFTPPPPFSLSLETHIMSISVTLFLCCIFQDSLNLPVDSFSIQTNSLAQTPVNSNKIVINCFEYFVSLSHTFHFSLWYLLYVSGTVIYFIKFQ